MVITTERQAARLDDMTTLPYCMSSTVAAQLVEEMKRLPYNDELMVGTEVQADCICVVYLCTVCVS